MDRPKILIITSRFPWPLDKGDKLRIYHQLKYLSDYYEIGLITFSTREISEGDMAEIRRYTSSLVIIQDSEVSRYARVLFGFTNSRPSQVNYFYKASIQEDINRFVRDFKPDIVYSHLARTYPYVESISKPIVVDLMDCFSAIAQKRAENENMWMRWFWNREEESMKKLEQEIVRTTTCQTLISIQEIEKLEIESTTTVKVVSNGIDTNYFRPLQSAKKWDILFVGNLSYYPNVEAVKYLYHKVLPEIRKRKPDIRFKIAGADPDSSVIALNNDYSFSVSGWTEDIVALYNESRIMMAPLFQGGGMQNKVLESLSCGIPVATSSDVKSAFSPDLDEVIIDAHSPQEFADRGLDLIENSKKYEQLSLESRRKITENYTWVEKNEKLKDIFAGILSMK